MRRSSFVAAGGEPVGAGALRVAHREWTQSDRIEISVPAREPEGDMAHPPGREPEGDMAHPPGREPEGDMAHSPALRAIKHQATAGSPSHAQASASNTSGRVHHPDVDPMAEANDSELPSLH